MNSTIDHPNSAMTVRRTSQEAHESTKPKLRELHQQVLAAFRRHGPMTDEELERLPQFAGYAPTTIRKRRGELCEAGELIEAGVKKNSRNRNMTVWKLTSEAGTQGNLF